MDNADDLRPRAHAVENFRQAQDLEEDDGLLRSSEVSQLKLNADLVILSACNSVASGQATGGEALSGLARAFFYAGARSVLVSHWYVESDAAVDMVTRMASEISADPALPRSTAMRRAMVALMNNTAKPGSWHPTVWAPFSIVGEGPK
jgi:CHAT domain-containing protein